MNKDTSSTTVPLQSPSTESWYTVMTGNNSVLPQESSTGFTTIHDNRTIASYSAKGTLIWQKRLPGKSAPFFTITDEDFSYTVTSTILVNDSVLSLYNPSGLCLWSVDTEYPIKYAPLVGRDGRVFVVGDNYISCYGIDGICRWKSEISNTLYLVELNDGSLLSITSEVVYNSEQKSAFSLSFRISPYGKILEKLTLSGKVTSAQSSKQGAILVFDDNSVGCLSVNNGNAFSLWKVFLPESEIQNRQILLISSQKSEYFTLLYLPDSHSISSELTITSYYPNKINQSIKLQTTFSFSITSDETYYSTNYNGNIFTLFTRNKTRFLGRSWNISTSQMIWNASFPYDRNYEKPFFLCNSGSVIFSCDDWCSYAFNVTKPAKNVKISNTVNVYSDFLKVLKADSSTISIVKLSQIENVLTSGYYAEKESELISYLMFASDELEKRLNKSTSNLWETPSFLDTNIANVAKIISVIGKTGISSFNQKLSWLIEKETDSTLLQLLIKTAGSIGYDPTGCLLRSIENCLNSTPSLTQNKLFSTTLCDSVYSICRYMGKPALYSQGKQILTWLLFPQFDEYVRDYARETLDKLIKLPM